MTPLRAARHSLIRAAISEYREAQTYHWAAERPLRSRGSMADCWAHLSVAELEAARDFNNRQAWWHLACAAAFAQQARAVGEAMRVLRILADNPIRLEPCLPPQCVWCEHQQPRYNGAHTPDCALARLVSPG